MTHTDARSWRETVASWSPARRRRHRELADALMTEGWSEPDACRLAFERLRGEDREVVRRGAKC